MFVSKKSNKILLIYSNRKWLNNIRMDLVQVGWGDVDWIGLAQDRDRWRTLLNSVFNLRVPLNAGKVSGVQTARTLSSSAQLHGVNLLVDLHHQYKPEADVSHSISVPPGFPAPS
jgi:hypothetical protein